MSEAASRIGFSDVSKLRRFAGVNEGKRSAAGVGARSRNPEAEPKDRCENEHD